MNKKTRRHRGQPGMGLKIQKLTIRAFFGSVGRLFPALTGRIAKSLWVRTQRFNPTPAEKAAAPKAKSGFFKVGNTHVATYEWGASGLPTILFIHGWSGRGTQCAPMLDTFLQAGYRVLAFDAPGHGRTGKNRTNIFEISEVIAAICAQYGPIKTVLTHSFGGPCAALALSNNAIPVEHMVCIAPPSDTDGLIDSFSQALNLPKATVNTLRRLIEKEFGEDAWQRSSMRENVKTLSVSALVIHDKDDREVPWEDGQSVASAWHEAEFVLTRAFGHRRIINAEVCSEVILPFLAQSDPQSNNDQDWRGYFAV